MVGRLLLAVLVLFHPQWADRTDAACEGPRRGSLLSEVPLSIAANSSSVCSWLFSVPGSGRALLTVDSLSGDPAYTELAVYDGSNEDTERLLMRLSASGEPSTFVQFALPVQASALTLVFQSSPSRSSVYSPNLTASLSVAEPSAGGAPKPSPTLSGKTTATVSSGAALSAAILDASVTDIVVQRDLTLSTTVELDNARRVSVRGTCQSSCIITLPGDARGFAVRSGSTLLLNGLTLANGTALHGAAALVAGLGSSLLATGVTFQGNVARRAAWLGLAGNLPVQAPCRGTFRDNLSLYGGGGCAAALDGASVSLTGGFLARNAALSGPGGCLFALRKSSLQATGSVFAENRAAYVSSGGYGGTIAALAGSSVSLTGVAISNSTSFLSGGGVFLASGAAASASNTTLRGCSTLQWPGSQAAGGSLAAFDSSVSADSLDMTDSFATDTGGCLSLVNSSFAGFATTLRRCRTPANGRGGAAVSVNETSSLTCNGCLVEAASHSGSDVSVVQNSTVTLLSTTVRRTVTSGGAGRPLQADCSASVDIGDTFVDVFSTADPSGSQAVVQPPNNLTWISEIVLGDRSPCRSLEEFSKSRGVCQCIRGSAFSPATGRCQCLPGTTPTAAIDPASGLPSTSCAEPVDTRHVPICSSYGTRYSYCIAAVVVGSVLGAAAIAGVLAALRTYVTRRARRNKQRELAMEAVVISPSELRVRHMYDDDEPTLVGDQPKAVSAMQLLEAAFVEYNGMQVFLRRIVHHRDLEDDASARWATGDDARGVSHPKRVDTHLLLSEPDLDPVSNAAWALPRGESGAPHLWGSSETDRRPTTKEAAQRRSTDAKNTALSQNGGRSSTGEDMAPIETHPRGRITQTGAEQLLQASATATPPGLLDAARPGTAASAAPTVSAVQLQMVTPPPSEFATPGRVSSLDKQAFVQGYLETAASGQPSSRPPGHLGRLQGAASTGDLHRLDSRGSALTNRSSVPSGGEGPPGQFSGTGGGGVMESHRSGDGASKADLALFGNFFSPDDNVPVASLTPHPPSNFSSEAPPPHRVTGGEDGHWGGGGATSASRAVGETVPLILKRGASAQNAFYNRVYKEQAALHQSQAGDSTMRDLEFRVTGDTEGTVGRGGRRMSVTAVGAESAAGGPRRISVTAPKLVKSRTSLGHAADTFGSTEGDVDKDGTTANGGNGVGPGGRGSLGGKVAPSPSGRLSAMGLSLAAVERSIIMGRESASAQDAASAGGAASITPGRPMRSTSRLASLAGRVSFNLSRRNSRVNPAPGMSTSKAHPRYQRIDWELSNLYELCHMRHPNVVRVFGGCSFNPERVDVLVEEHMAFGPLCDLLALRAVSVETETLLQIASDIAQGCLYLHDRDPPVVAMLTSRKVLISADLTAKIQLDFHVDQEKSMSQQSQVGFGRNGGVQHITIWSAPEILILEEGSPQPPVDVYAFGLVLFELFTREAPFQKLLDAQMDPEEIIADILEKDLRPVFPSHAGAHGIKNLAIDCWTRNPLRRPNFDEVIDVLSDIERKLHPEMIDSQTLNYLPSTNQGGGSSSRQQVSPLRGLSSTQSHPEMAPLMPPLHDMMPASVIEALKNGKRPKPEVFENVTVFFSDIVGFTDLSSELSPEKVTSMLDRLYRELDNLSAKFELFKAETIGDAFLAVAGIPHFQSDHVARVAAFALSALAAASKTLIDLNDPSRGHVKLRIGFHPGPLSAAVVGTMRPKYTVLGDTVNTASRMESNSEAGRANMSKAAADLLLQMCPGIELEARGRLAIKGKGQIECFFLCNTPMNVALLQGVIKPSNPASHAPERPLQPGRTMADIDAATNNVTRF